MKSFATAIALFALVLSLGGCISAPIALTPQTEQRLLAQAPIRTAPGYDLHLLDAADHCAHVTSDLARATGLILARRAAP